MYYNNKYFISIISSPTNSKCREKEDIHVWMIGGAGNKSLLYYVQQRNDSLSELKNNKVYLYCFHSTLLPE